jgi:hypothetical protein
MIPEELEHSGLEAPGLPEGESGWPADSFREALRRLPGKTAVVAIQVFDPAPWGYAATDDTWQCVRSRGELAGAFAARSRREADSWVAVFPRHDVLFVPAFSSQDDADSAMAWPLRA